jgi:hypothetical protein
MVIIGTVGTLCCLPALIPFGRLLRDSPSLKDALEIIGILSMVALTLGTVLAAVVRIRAKLNHPPKSD